MLQKPLQYNCLTLLSFFCQSSFSLYQIFHDVAYKAKDRSDLLAGIDEFLDQVTVLPPGEWDPSIRIEPPKNVPSQVQSLDKPLFFRSATTFICVKENKNDS